jgi:glycogen operon protein
LIRGKNVRDITFLDPSGNEMNDQAWSAGFVRSLGIRLAGDVMEDVDEKGDRLYDDTLLILLNGHHESIPFLFPPLDIKQHWEYLLDTAEPTEQPHVLRKGAKYELKGRSLALFRTVKNGEAG